jgi:hypothetical protein
LPFQSFIFYFKGLEAKCFIGIFTPAPPTSYFSVHRSDIGNWFIMLFKLMFHILDYSTPRADLANKLYRNFINQMRQFDIVNTNLKFFFFCYFTFLLYIVWLSFMGFTFNLLFLFSSNTKLTLHHANQLIKTFTIYIFIYFYTHMFHHFPHEKKNKWMNENDCVIEKKNVIKINIGWDYAKSGSL